MSLPRSSEICASQSHILTRSMQSALEKSHFNLLQDMCWFHEGLTVLSLEISEEKLGGDFSHCAYLCHRASLLGPLEISAALPTDMPEILDFLEDDEEKQAYVEVLEGKAAGSTVYLARVIGQIAAVARVRKCAAPGTYTKYYEVDGFIDPAHYGADEHLDIENVLFNPIFTRSAPDMVKQIMCMTGTCCAYSLLQPDVSHAHARAHVHAHSPAL